MGSSGWGDFHKSVVCSELLVNYKVICVIMALQPKYLPDNTESQHLHQYFSDSIEAAFTRSLGLLFHALLPVFVEALRGKVTVLMGDAAASPHMGHSRTIPGAAHVCPRARAGFEALTLFQCRSCGFPQALTPVT